MKNSFFQRLARRGKDSQSDAAAALTDIENDLIAVQAALVDLEARYGERVVATHDEAAIEVIEAEIAGRRTDVARLAAAKAAVSARLDALRAASAKKSNAERWIAAAKALQARNQALDRFDAAVKVAAQAGLEAEAAARVAFEAMPIQELSGARLTIAFGSLGRELDLLLSIHSDGRFGALADSSLWEYRQQPTLQQRATESAAWWLSACSQPGEAA